MMRMNSLVYKMASRLTIILVILFMILVTSNIYSLNVVQTNYYTSSQNTLNLYSITIQNYLDNVSRDLLEVFETHSEIAYNIEKLNETGLYFQSLELKNALMTKMSHNSSSDVMFISSDQYDYQILFFGNRINTSNKLEISDALSSKTFNSQVGQYYGEWKHILIGDNHYIYKTIGYNDFTFGTVVNADTLFSTLNYIDQDHVSYYVRHINNTVITSVLSSDYRKAIEINDLAFSVEETNEYLVTTEHIESLGTIAAVAEKQYIFSGLQFIQWFLVALAIIAIVVVPLVIRSLSSAIIKPIIELSKTAKEVEKGGGHFKPPSQTYSMEFTKLFHAFQSMVNEIRELKIQAYEEELVKKRVQLDYLQLQIRPHFYLNAISTITSLTYQNKNEEIRSFIQYLSHYLRYKFNPALHLVTIQDELKQVSNYIKMQEIRYPNQVFYLLDSDSGTEQVKIPNFIMQTFIENSFKHAMFYEEVLTLFVKISYKIRDGEKFVQMTIEDNGEGYRYAYLEMFKSGELSQNDGNEHIGILNIKKTLELLYKRKDLLYLSNQDQFGARVEIWIPMPCDDNEEG